LEHELAVVATQPGEPAVEEAAEEAERGRDAEPWRGVPGAEPVVLEPETRAVGPRRVRAVADRERPDQVLAVAPHVQEGGTLRRAQPLVAVAGEVRGAEPVEVEVEHARRVRA